MPKTAEEAKQAVDALKQVNVDAIKAILDAGAGGRVFNRLDPQILNAIAAEARADGLPIVVHIGDVRDVEDALNAGVNGIEHGSFRQRIPDSDFALMAKNGVTYDPTLSVVDALPQFAAGKLDLLNRSLVQQAAPAKLLGSTRRLIESPEAVTMRKSIGDHPIDMNIARDNLLRAWKAGVTLITGSDAGNMLVFHGPTTQHEMELWVTAGIPPQVALEAATLNSARALRAAARFGSIEKGKEATMLVVDGNPLVDIKATEAISFVMFKGERVNRAALLNQE
jgi:imidazolonepropionase-like amidohydrolase